MKMKWEKINYEQDGNPMAIVKVPSGKYYNEYAYDWDMCGNYIPTMMAGPYDTLEQAEAMMAKHRPNSNRV